MPTTHKYSIRPCTEYMYVYMVENHVIYLKAERTRYMRKVALVCHGVNKPLGSETLVALLEIRKCDNRIRRKAYTSPKTQTLLSTSPLATSPFSPHRPMLDLVKTYSFTIFFLLPTLSSYRIVSVLLAHNRFCVDLVP